MTTVPDGCHLIPDDVIDITAPTSNCNSKHTPNSHPPLVCTHASMQPCWSPHLHATNHSKHTTFHGNRFNPDMGKVTEYGALCCSPDGAHWQAANVVEIHHLAQGTSAVPSTNTMFFILVTSLPAGCKATYLCIVCAHCPKKTVTHHVHWTVGSDWINHDGNVSTKTADLTTAKLFFNNIISMPKARCMMGDLKDFYLGVPILCIHERFCGCFATRHH